MRDAHIVAVAHPGAALHPALAWAAGLAALFRRPRRRLDRLSRGSSRSFCTACGSMEQSLPGRPKKLPRSTH